MSTALREDALQRTADGVELAIGLPWIRSLALNCVLGLEVLIDGEPVESVCALVDGRLVELAALAEEPGWWFLQDRLRLAAPGSPAPGEHRVEVAMELLIPYLSAGGERPLIVPIRLSEHLKV
ncbi:hypothetical protein SAMN06295885_1969 [Rathayibacter oskolensis]|uniref:Uncharacterized protein n=1 Tax=Rathayibacter oskolensis TaxID=1891671 RepID=A0A1X7NW70_9MICO|nr:hypothetical protein [Rathayibacter oskolensis]SMH42398.1 hypothetical protein SAMN06295885_1969 [Rathayibacter oskolensis]